MLNFVKISDYAINYIQDNDLNEQQLQQEVALENLSNLGQSETEAQADPTSRSGFDALTGTSQETETIKTETFRNVTLDLFKAR